AGVAQLQGRPIAGLDLVGLPDDLIESLSSPVEGIRTVVLCELVLDAVDREFALGDTVAIAANQGAKVGCVADVVVQIVVPESDVARFSGSIGDRQRNDDSAVIGQMRFEPI